MKIFFDENFSCYLAKGLSCFEEGSNRGSIEVFHITDSFKCGTADEIWIPSVAKMQGIVISQDFDIRRTRHLCDLCQQHKLGIFFFRPPHKSPYAYWDIIRCVMTHWENIKKCSLSTSRPFGYSFTPRAKELERLS